jgi:RNA polymerase sigma-70 factor, ECF subfamily
LRTQKDFTLIYNEYKDKVYTIACRTLGDAGNAMDVSQDIFVKIYENPGKLPGAGELGAYIYRMTVNRCIDYLRKKNPLRLLKDTDVAASGEAFPADTSDEVGFLLSDLNPDQKTAIILKEIIGLSIEETAQVCSVDQGTVKSRLSRAKEIMRGTYARRALQ